MNFPPNLEHDSSKKIMFSMSYTLFPWCLTVDVGISRGAWQPRGPTHRPPHRGLPCSPVLHLSMDGNSPLFWGAHIPAVLTHRARLGYMPEVHHGQSSSCLLAPVYRMPSESPGRGAFTVRLTPGAGQCWVSAFSEPLIREM